MEASILNITSLMTICAAIMLLAWELARYFTEVRPLPWRVKPFTCRPCLTFWLTLALAWLALRVMTPLWYGAIVGAGILAFINFFIIKIKFKVYE